MKLMINGTWRSDIDPAPELEGQRMIHAGRFRDRITADASFSVRTQSGQLPSLCFPGLSVSRRGRAVATIGPWLPAAGSFQSFRQRTG